MTKKQAFDARDIDEIVKPWGISHFGVADLAPARDYIEKEHGRALLHYPRAIVMALAYPRQVVNQLAEGPTHTYLYYYNVLNRVLDEAALSLANRLQALGYDSFPIPASQRVGEDRLSGIFSHRLAGQLAGLGWIGRSASLIHPDLGPRLRLVTVLTDCLLETDSPMDNRCGACRACVEACPAGALTGVSFEENKNLEPRFHGQRCDEYLLKVRSSFGKRVCGRCLAVCPYGKKG